MIVWFRMVLKTFYFLLFLVSYFGSSILIYLLSLANMEKARKMLVKNISLHSKIGLKMLGVHLHFDHRILEQNHLIVANHLSYLDILCISSIIPTCFVTSVEMKETPFLGQMCTLGGCLFVERRSRKGLSSEVSELSEALKKGLNVCIFPEAKSTNGEKVLGFKRPLFQAAIDAKRSILPLCLNYQSVDGEKLSLKNRDDIFWYGDTSFVVHFFRMIRHRKLKVRISVLDSIDVSSDVTKVELADMSYFAIEKVYLPVSS